MSQEMSSILVVDDDTFMRETLKMTLGPRYSYGVADSVYGAEKELASKNYDLVLLDLHMPGGSGINLLPTIRRTCPETDVVIITAFGCYEAALEAIRHKVAGFLEKDFSPIELQELVADTIRSRRQQRLLMALHEKLKGTELEGALEQLEAPVNRPHTPPSNLIFFRTLASVLESQDYVTAGHSLRVSRYAVAVARQLGLDEAAVADVELAGYVHDLGKVGVNKSVLNKEGQLSRLDWVEIKRHPALGARILHPLGFSAGVLDGVRYHHERLDGSGYPEGIPADAIGLHPRLIGVVDSFDAMTWPRLYRKVPIPPLRALEILRAEAPEKYEPEMVEALKQALEDGTIRMDTSCDPIRSRTRADLDREEDHGPSSGGDPGENRAQPMEGGEEEMTPDLKADEGVLRARFAPLGDLYANPGQLERMVVPVIKPPSGEAYCLMPGGEDAGPREVPLLMGNLIRFYELVADNELRPFYARPGTLTVTPDMHLTPENPLPGRPAMQEFSDGKKVYIADLQRQEAGGPITYSLRAGRIHKTVESVELRLDRLLAAAVKAGVKSSQAEGILEHAETWLEQHKDLLTRTPTYRRQLTQLPWVEYHALSDELRDQLEAALQDQLAGEVDAEVRCVVDQLRLRSSFEEPGTMKVTFTMEDQEGDFSLLDEAGELALEELPVYSREMNEILDAVRLRARRDAGHKPSVADLLRREGDQVKELELIEALTPLLFQLQNCLWGYDRTFEALALGAVIGELGQQHQALIRGGAQGDRLMFLKLKMFPVVMPRARHLLRDLLVDRGGDQPLHRVVASGMASPSAELHAAVRALGRISEAMHNPFAAHAARCLRQALGVLEDAGPAQSVTGPMGLPVEVYSLLLGGVENLMQMPRPPAPYRQLLDQCAASAAMDTGDRLAPSAVLTRIALMDIALRSGLSRRLCDPAQLSPDMAAGARVLWPLVLACWGVRLQLGRRRELARRKGRGVLDVAYGPLFSPGEVRRPGQAPRTAGIIPLASGPLLESRKEELKSQTVQQFRCFRAGTSAPPAPWPAFLRQSAANSDLPRARSAPGVEVKVSECRQLLLFSQEFSRSRLTVDLQMQEGAALAAYIEAMSPRDDGPLSCELVIENPHQDTLARKVLRRDGAPILWVHAEIQDSPTA